MIESHESMTAKLCAFARAYHSTYARKSGKRFIRSTMPAVSYTHLMLCKQYCRDGFGMVYLFSLNRARADMDVVFHRGSGRSLTCFGRVMIHGQPLPEQHM